ncbi:hypothetical protein Apa02nite_028990 [Actinoplanes palleronii]|uniref:Uncharacterized protein n=2 Tax=Actinoplanes palleronii TaxID=113570 RepID=A0ABQ4B8N2_9ACTN|nr:hypothetical protein Apa02nite_028990 [Actinoplanes palleronii]
MSSRAQPCRHCGRPVVIRMTQAGKSWPFDNDLVSVDADLPEELRYIPAPGRDGVIMIPVIDVSDQRLVGVRWYAVRHICAEWLRTRQANRRGDVNRAMSVDWSGDAPATFAPSTDASAAEPDKKG